MRYIPNWDKMKGEDMNRKKVERHIKLLYPNTRTNFYKSASRGGWVILPFGKTERFAGRTLQEAYETVTDALTEKEQRADDIMRVNEKYPDRPDSEGEAT